MGEVIEDIISDELEADIPQALQDTTHKSDSNRLSEGMIVFTDYFEQPLANLLCTNDSAKFEIKIYLFTSLIKLWTTMSNPCVANI